ncbi:hypothetical protein GGU10DRAFT_374624 [Lentinula aff. detonsa]|uniref:Uncharacterized protein n=1 Tax=Lentinula aff. detonsa TaxID=2804958 RepID=A0AA38L674_9AGAR|nr:hypothetical protein GGU10DRAFT_374624 [Lentinula aff. detonsa]
MRATASIILASIVLAIVGPAMSVAIPSDPLLSKRAPGYRVDAYQDINCAGIKLGSLVPGQNLQTFHPEAHCALIVRAVPSTCVLFLLHDGDSHMYDKDLKARRHIDDIAFNGMEMQC